MQWGPFPEATLTRPSSCPDQGSSGSTTWELAIPMAFSLLHSGTKFLDIQTFFDTIKDDEFHFFL